jgi:hypothetical protein
MKEKNGNIQAANHLLIGGGAQSTKEQTNQKPAKEPSFGF